MDLRPLTCLIAAVATGTGCAAQQHRALPHGEQAVATITFRGNHAVEAGELAAGLALARARDQGTPFEDALVRADRRRLRARYMRRGYFAVRVEAEVQSVAGGVAVRFAIDEGARARLTAVAITGLPADVPAAALRDALALDDGAAFDYAAYDGAKPRWLAALEDRGYAHARVDASVEADPARATATVTLAVTPGPRARFGPVTLTGVGGGLAGAARARLTVREGAPYSSSAVRASRAAIYDVGRFASVEVQPDRSGGGEIVPVAVTLAEADRHQLQLGGGVGIDPAHYELRTRLGYSVAGFPGDLTTTRLDLRPAVVRLRDAAEYDPRVEATVGLDRIDLFRPRLLGQVEAGFSYVTVEAYTSVGPRLRLAASTPLGPRVLVAAGWQLQLLAFRAIDPAVSPALATSLRLDRSDRLGFYEESLTVDLRDDPVAPRRGGYAELRAEEGTVAAGGSLAYVKLTPELRGFAPLGPVTLATRVRAGVIVGDVPVTQRYFAGGAYSQRGFPERRLAPTATSVIDGVTRTAAYGGAALVEAGAELRVPLGAIRGVKVGGVGFVDGADVTERWQDVALANLHWAAGAGLRVPTVIGPVRFDIGVRLNRFGDGELRPGDRVAYHLSIGEAF